MSRWIDFALVVFLLALVPFALAAYGGHVAADSNADAHKRRTIKLKFWGMGFVGLLVAIAYQYRTMKMDDMRQTQTQQFQNSVNSRLEQIINHPASKEQQREATKLRQLVKAANPATPRLGMGPDAYKEISDGQVGQWAMEEADKIEELAHTSMKSGLGSPSAEQWFFANKFKDCCAQDVLELRTEILRRLGPPAKDPDEISAWTMLFPQIENPSAPRTINPARVTHYAPHLWRLGLQLKRRQISRAAPKALHFSEAQVAPETPSNSPYNIVVTIKTGTAISAGYIVVEFDGPLGSVSCDFIDSKLVHGDDTRLADNKEAREYLGIYKTPKYALAIGKTPFTPEKPLHVFASGGPTQFHVAMVTLFDE